MPPFAPALQDIDDVSLGESSFCVQPPKKSVRIDIALNDVRLIPTVGEMTSHEVSSAWFTRTETTVIRNTLMQSIAKMNVGESFDEETDSSRGLELFTHEGALKRECNKLRLRRSVLEEQERQRDAGVRDDEKLASVAATCAVPSNEFAVSMAEADEDQVLCDMEEYEDEILLQKANASRSVLNFCCFDYGLACLKLWQ